MVLYEGLVKVTARLDRDRVLLRDIRIAGDIVGEVAAMGVGPRSATVTACGDVAATVVPRNDLEHLFLAHPEASLALNRMLSAADCAEPTAYGWSWAHTPSRSGWRASSSNSRSRTGSPGRRLELLTK
ncbi:Crp/Fnr family transcriptional regulator [Streptomyces dangxiongensis]|uniref:Crp/Fnr family transcriptional regulator n=1 Tax=Streptomyces dangxiongensis TaxID=1442032 RepID=UPI0013CEE1CE|nr:cyclic nucleotide-binding domain-containing protein [Streptomyces dangxiongensis]